jgi:hypothetical protein
LAQDILERGYLIFANFFLGAGHPGGGRFNFRAFFFFHSNLFSFENFHVGIEITKFVTLGPVTCGARLALWLVIGLRLAWAGCPPPRRAALPYLAGTYHQLRCYPSACMFWLIMSSSTALLLAAAVVPKTRPQYCGPKPGKPTAGHRLSSLLPPIERQTSWHPTSHA